MFAGKTYVVGGASRLNGSMDNSDAGTSRTNSLDGR
jgi:hypothetical protein